MPEFRTGGSNLSRQARLGALLWSYCRGNNRTNHSCVPRPHNGRQGQQTEKTSTLPEPAHCLYGASTPLFAAREYLVRLSIRIRRTRNLEIQLHIQQHIGLGSNDVVRDCDLKLQSRPGRIGIGG